MNRQQEDGKPWWREPWPWILMAGPAVAVVGCIITIVLALDGYSTESVQDGGSKRGLVVVKEQGKLDSSIVDATSVE